jgi:hypothetical protein
MSGADESSGGPSVDPDYFIAYGLTSFGLDSNELTTLYQQLKQTKRTFAFLEEAILSNRYPYTIMVIAAKIGMYIPPRKRVGLATYQFLINNIQYYETAFDREGSGRPPNIYEIAMSRDKIGLLSRYRDNEILQPGYKFTRNYSARREMIESFIANNITVHGQFKLESCSRSSYSTKARVIAYTDLTTRLQYSTTELLSLFDMTRGVVWKDPRAFYEPQVFIPFSRLSLHHLRQQVLERLEQWRHRDGYTQSESSPELHNLLNNLESILSTEPRNEASAYLGNPVL